MTNESAKTVMSRFIKFINTADEKLAQEIISQKAVFYVPGRPDPLKGPEGYLSIVGMMRGGFSDVQWYLDELIVEDDNVAARFTMTGTHDGAFFGVPPTRKSINIRAINIYHLQNGQVVEEFSAPDLIGLLGQIGAFPPQ
ncbi:ester cyclase [Mucilaginibacter sp.]|uniref:ester cyclase n=1 Tax=Mucilaginibacter sp. TaxID=1882438 RepID=UPI0025F84C7B|nr:ester cyclase [Mucilaginibacter sp.]